MKNQNEQKKNKINDLGGSFWVLQVYFVAIKEKNTEKRAIFLSIVFESGNSDNDPK